MEQVKSLDIITNAYAMRYSVVELRSASWKGTFLILLLHPPSLNHPAALMDLLGVVIMRPFITVTFMMGNDNAGYERIK